MSLILSPLAGECSAIGAAGLVTVSTTHTPPGGPIPEPLLRLSEGQLALEKDRCRFARLRKNVGVAAKLHEAGCACGPRGGRRVQKIMVTLTYGDAFGWRPEHIRAYLNTVRAWYSRRSGGGRLAYVWVAEMQAHRDTPTIHYHVIFWISARIRMPKADRLGWWPHGSTNTLVAKKPIGYLMKYASKFESKEGLPHGARIYGVGGLDAAGRGLRRWCNLPGFVQARASVAEASGWRRAVGGGWVDGTTGDWWPSEWGLCFTTRTHSVILRVHDHGRPLAEVVGPYSWIYPGGGGSAAPQPGTLTPAVGD